MRYQGGKARIAKDIVEVIMTYRKFGQLYVEPFIGGANVFAAMNPEYGPKLGSDSNADMALLWSAVARGWEPPDVVTEKEYKQDKASKEPSPLRGFIGSACSWGGRFFEGYARDPKVGRNYARYGANWIRKNRYGFLNSTYQGCDYRELQIPD